VHTVCQAAHCPNLGECFSAGTATLMILGDVCTRNCRFCGVRSGRPATPDPTEPGRVAEAVAEMALAHVVLTSVTRDDLADGGGAIWAETIGAIRRACPRATIEVLCGDFAGCRASCRLLLDARADVFAHNVETVPRLYPAVRARADYGRSLMVLRWGREAGLTTKSSVMVGLGETPGEVASVLGDLRDAGVRIVTIGQYLCPSRRHVPVAEYISPERFDSYRNMAEAMDFAAVVSGPLVRSSYHAAEAARLARTP